MIEAACSVNALNAAGEGHADRSGKRPNVSLADVRSRIATNGAGFVLWRLLDLHQFDAMAVPVVTPLPACNVGVKE